ncbi:SI12B-like protein [Mya arenaria]|uniref:SI12B-like protein n=1 Tax=Mya arenaria TaxID=6604 RepID=A0ABY7FE85_MYAAR|nr:SI12B-like protein [Mya arenaria]
MKPRSFQEEKRTFGCQTTNPTPRLFKANMRQAPGLSNLQSCIPVLRAIRFRVGELSLDAVEQLALSTLSVSAFSDNTSLEPCNSEIIHTIWMIREYFLHLGGVPRLATDSAMELVSLSISSNESEFIKESTDGINLPSVPLIGEVPLEDTKAMWNVILATARAYAPAITLPIAIVVGFIGYNAETLFSDKTTPYKEKTKIEEREERKLREIEGELDNEDNQRYSKGIPKTVLDRNQFRKCFSEGSTTQES